MTCWLSVITPGRVELRRTMIKQGVKGANYAFALDLLNRCFGW